MVKDKINKDEVIYITEEGERFFEENKESYDKKQRVINKIKSMTLYEFKALHIYTGDKGETVVMEEYVVGGSDTYYILAEDEDILKYYIQKNINNPRINNGIRRRIYTTDTYRFYEYDDVDNKVKKTYTINTIHESINELVHLQEQVKKYNCRVNLNKKEVKLVILHHDGTIWQIVKGDSIDIGQLVENEKHKISKEAKELDRYINSIIGEKEW